MSHEESLADDRDIPDPSNVRVRRAPPGSAPMSRETSAFCLRELKFKAGAARTFTGYGAVFDNIDSYGDAIQRGAFRQSLAAHKAAGTMPALLAQHGGFLSGADMMPI